MAGWWRAKLDEAHSKQHDDLLDKQEKWYQEQSKYLKRMWETRDDVRIPIPKKQKMKFGLLLELGDCPAEAREGAYKDKIDGKVQKITPEEEFGCFGKYKLRVSGFGSHKYKRGLDE